MDALVMCGGAGSRLDADREKPLLEIGGIPMVDRVLAALRSSSIDRSHAVTSPAAPRTEAHIRENYGEDEQIDVIEGSGDGYVADLDVALEAVGAPVLTVVADLPLLEGDAIDSVLEDHESGSMTICVPVAKKAALGVSVDRTIRHEGTEVAATGVNVVGDQDSQTIMITADTRLTVNVNRIRDAWVAEVFS